MTSPDSSLTSPGSSGRQGGISATDSGQSSSSTTTLVLAMPAEASGATPMKRDQGSSSSHLLELPAATPRPAKRAPAYSWSVALRPDVQTHPSRRMAHGGQAPARAKPIHPY